MGQREDIGYSVQNKSPTLVGDIYYYECTAIRAAMLRVTCRRRRRDPYRKRRIAETASIKKRLPFGSRK